MRLLPRDSGLSWTPYAWLIYLSIFVAAPLAMDTSPARWALVAVGLAVFLPLYFLGFWLKGRQALGVIAAIALLGVVFAPSNAGASVFFVYAAAFAGLVGRPRAGFLVIAAIVAVVGIESLAFHLSPFFWGSAGIFSVLIGAVNIQQTQAKESNRCLRVAQDEIERLAKVAERERIARDMHDVLGHTLSVVILKSQLAARLAEQAPARARAEMLDVERTAREALADVRRTIGGYRAGSLEAEIERARTTLRTAGVAVEFEWNPPPLSPVQEAALVFALREAVTNVVRHAAATSCRFSLAEVEGCCRLVIHDDGRGGTSAEGLGLRGMRERVKSLGGAIERETERGTRLVIRFPLQPSSGSVPA